MTGFFRHFLQAGYLWVQRSYFLFQSVKSMYTEGHSQLSRRKCFEFLCGGENRPHEVVIRCLCKTWIPTIEQLISGITMLLVFRNDRNINEFRETLK